MRFSATVMSSWTALVSENRREFRWSCTLTHIMSIICTAARCEVSDHVKVCVRVCVCCACLLRGGGDYSLLQPVRLLLEVFTRLVVPQQVLLHLRRQNTTRASSAHKTNDTQEHNEEQSL